MGVTRIGRGRDLLTSAPKQLWLFGELGYAAPAYCHVPLLTDKTGRRLSKRDKDLDMGVLRAHTTPEKLVGYLASLSGLIARPEPVQAKELIGIFSWEKVGTKDIAVPSRLPDDLIV